MTNGRLRHNILRSSDRVEVDPILAFVAGARLREMDRDVLGSLDWIVYDCKSDKLSAVAG